MHVLGMGLMIFRGISFLYCVTFLIDKCSLQCHQSKSRREILLEYVKNVQPEFMELFVKRAPQQVSHHCFNMILPICLERWLFLEMQGYLQHYFILAADK